MVAHINEDELKLLVFLHENVKAFGREFPLQLRTVALGLSIDEEQVKRNASYLAEHGLAGLAGQKYANSRSMEFVINELFLTGLGEEYVRALEQAPGVARKLTVAVVSELWSSGKGIIVSVAGQLLAEFAKHYHPSA